MLSHPFLMGDINFPIGKPHKILDKVGQFHKFILDEAVAIEQDHDKFYESVDLQQDEHVELVSQLGVGLVVEVLQYLLGDG